MVAAERVTKPIIPEQADGTLSPLEAVRLRLLREKKWRYLRYRHLREAFRHAGDCATVLSIGAGRAYAELALALEFPDKRFHVTDIHGEETPCYQKSQALAEHWQLGNITFGICDVLDASQPEADLVMSVEVLEHIEDDAQAAANMRALARRAVFCLVPFADAAAQADPERRRLHWEQHRHFRPGYSAADLTGLFPEPRVIRGCYWRDAGILFRRKLNDLPPDRITLDLALEAEADVRFGVPWRIEDSAGIWILASR